MADEERRYAIYFTPSPLSALWRYGSAVIGYDAYIANVVPFAVPEGYDEATWSRLTEEPRRYGFHATLKAPFYLAGGATEADLLAAVAHFAERQPPIAGLALKTTCIGRFVVLRIGGDTTAVGALAASIVTELDDFRAALMQADRKRRLATNLTERQRALLDRYGYPYVLEEFRFHMTLAGPLPKGEGSRVCSLLAADFVREVPSQQFAIDALTVLRQDHRSGHFRIMTRLPLQGRRSSPAALP